MGKGGDGEGGKCQRAQGRECALDTPEMFAHGLWHDAGACEHGRSMLSCCSCRTFSPLLYPSSSAWLHKHATEMSGTLSPRGIVLLLPVDTLLQSHLGHHVLLGRFLLGRLGGSSCLGLLLGLRLRHLCKRRAHTFKHNVLLWALLVMPLVLHSGINQRRQPGRPLHKVTQKSAPGTSQDEGSRKPFPRAERSHLEGQRASCAQRGALRHCRDTLS